MTPESPAQPKGMGEFARLTGVFFEPAKTFADIAARPRWIVPLLILIVLSFAIASTFSSKGLTRIAAAQQLANNQQFQNLPADQREQGLERAEKIGTIIGYCIPVIIPVLYLIIALTLWAIASGILSAPIRFGQVFAIVVYAELPSAIKAILLFLVVQMKAATEINMQNPLMFNPAAFMDPQTTSKALYAFASWFDLFNIWIILLIATGLKAAAGKKLSFGGALFAVLLPWAVLILCSVGFTAMFS